MSDAEKETTPEPVVEGSVRELMVFLCPELARQYGKCPPWPPDVFGLVATVMRRTGAYVRSVPSGCSEQIPAQHLLDLSWPTAVRSIGAAWRNALQAAFKKHVRPDGMSFAEVLRTVVVPPEVQDTWFRLAMEAVRARCDDALRNDTLSKALIELLAYADEASAGIGLPAIGSPKDQFCSAASLFLQKNRMLSFCSALDPLKVRVLGKKHTPQQGLTLRSMSHHLSLCMPWEVEAQWYEFDAPRVNDVLNLLLLPWPLDVEARHFRCVDAPVDHTIYVEHRTFEYRRKELTELEVRQKVEGAIDAALEKVSRVHAIVLPELALTRAEWNIAEEIAIKRQVLLISGIMDDVDDTSNLPVNSCRIQLATLRTRRQEREPASTERPPYHKQTKHHRWSLDRGQVLQYDLGSQLPSSMQCWENSHVARRGIFFATLGGWLTFSVLICEDLARQDPIAEVLRSVGPNLVIALLMDGPQLGARWSARYASVLADDPGSSVLTLTSLGMSVRSRPSGVSNFEPSRVIALWKDKLYGAQEIALDKTSVGCVLSLSCETREEFTADGRSDRKATQIPVFSGVFQI